MVTKNQKRYKNTFFLENKEFFLRSLWFAYKVSSNAFEKYNIVTGNYLIRDMLNRDKERKIFFEIIGYTVSFVLKKLRDDIEETEGWTDESYDLNLSYHVFLSLAFDQVFELKEKKESIFLEIFEAYYNSNNYVFEETKKEWSLFDDDGNFIVENLHAYRINQIVKVVDRKKVADNANQYYKNIGMLFYKKAFFDLDLRQIETELAKMV